MRYGLRALAGSRRFTGAALGTIVLMLGGITTVFTLVHAVLLRPLPYPDATRLAIVKSTEPKGLGTGVALPDVLTFQQESRSFDGWALFRVGYVTTVLDARDNTPDWPVQDMRVTPDLFPLLGIEVVIGRPLLPVDSEPAASDVVVISHDLWQAQFAGEADVLDKTIHVGRQALHDCRRDRARRGRANELADVPDRVAPGPRSYGTALSGSRQSPGCAKMCRLRAAVRSSSRWRRSLAGEQPATHRHRTTTATLLLDEIVGDYKRVLWLFFGAVLCVLLIGMGNLISLQVTRNGEREREIYLRAALGASRWQIVRQLLIESILLSAIGGAIGFGLAWPGGSADRVNIAGAIPQDGSDCRRRMGRALRVWGLTQHGYHRRIGFSVARIPCKSHDTSERRRPKCHAELAPEPVTTRAHCPGKQPSPSYC